MNQESQPFDVIFLDIDGVLNVHDFNDESGSNPIHPDKVAILNHIIKETNAQVVISSAWRYMIHKEAMTTHGFEYMLRTHGVTKSLVIAGITCSDEYLGWSPGNDVPVRGKQILKWIKDYRPRKYVVIDDLVLDIPESKIPFVKIDGLVGLTMSDAEKVIEILNK